MKRWWVPILVLLAGAAARLSAWREVFTPDGVRFLYDTDPLYHLLQAQRALRSGFSPTWFDPMLSWPAGAPVLWPPLWDLLIAASTRIVFGAGASPAQLERVAALLPVVVGLATLPLVAALGRRLLEPGRGALAALVVALLVANVSVSMVGRPDQHALEVLLATALMAGFARAATGAEPRALLVGSATMAVATALAFWNWQGSALALLVPGLVAALGHVVLDRAGAARIARALALGTGVATLLLLSSVAAWGAPGALGRGTLQGLSLLHVVITASVAAFGGGLLLVQRLAPRAGPLRRTTEPVVVALVVGAVVLAGSESIRRGVAHGLAALSASSAWYAYIGEYRPPFLGCQLPLLLEVRNFLSTYGLAIPVGLLAIPSLVRRWRRDEARGAVLLLATWAGTFLLLALVRVRFAPYLCVPLALLAAEGVVAMAAWMGDRFGWARRLGRPALLAGLTLLVVAPSVASLLGPAPGGEIEPPEAARWLAKQPRIEGREGVLAPWPSGHAFLYYAGRPVVVSPFGTDVGEEPMTFASTLLLSTQPEEVEDALIGRRVGYLVVGNPIVNLPLDQLLAPGRPRLATVQCSLSEGPTIAYTPDALRGAGARLSRLDGGSPDGTGSPFTRLRLVHESPALGRPDAPRTSLKVYEVVPGAILRIGGATPGSTVRAVARVRTDSGRSFGWGAAAIAGPDGTAVLRVPYADGENGGSAANVSVSDGTRTVRVPLTGLDVETGRWRDVALGP